MTARTRNHSLAAALVLAPAIARAAVIPVAAGDSAGLIAAIQAANAADDEDTIDLACDATYTLVAANTGVDGLPVVTSRIVLNGNRATIVRSPSAPDFRILEIGDGGDLVLNQVTISGGRAPDPNGGGGILLGGDGKLTVNGGTITDNRCLGAICLGGGILVKNLSSATLTDTTVSNNTAAEGGGIEVFDNNHLTILRGRIIGNTATSVSNFVDGGGIASVGFNNPIVLTDTTVSGNMAVAPANRGASGGGLSDEGGANWTIANSTISGNHVIANSGSATGNGGAMANEAGGTSIVIVNSTISGNTVVNGGGGPAHGGGLSSEGGSPLTLNNVTITANSAATGGGMSVTATSVTLQNTIIAANVASGASPDCLSNTALTTNGHNLVQDTTGCMLTPVGSDITGQPAGLDGLADNGGPTLTHALQQSSMAVNAGDPGIPGSGGTACEAADQRGVTRPQGVRCDIGAFERGGTPSSTTTTVPPGCAAPTTTTTTTTTLPGGCGPRAATFESIDCRLDQLVANLQSATDLGRLQRGLVNVAMRARTKKQTAEAIGTGKKARKQMKQAVKALRSFVHKLSLHTARKKIPPATRQAFTQEATPIVADMQTLLGQL